MTGVDSKNYDRWAERRRTHPIAQFSPILVVDDDVNICSVMQVALDDLGVRQLAVVNDGREAWEEVNQRQFGLIVLDWKLPNCGGLCFLNKLRRLPNYASTPVLIVSGIINATDFRYLDEVPFTSFLEKPFTLTQLASQLDTLINETGWFKNHRSDLESFVTQAAHGTPDFTHIATSPRPEPIALYCARLLMTRGHLSEAHNLLETMIQTTPRCALANTLLGQINLMTGKREQAKVYLNHAKDLMPRTISRLCLIGQAEMMKLPPEEAQLAFERALASDSHASISSTVSYTPNLEGFLGSQRPSDSLLAYSRLQNLLAVAALEDSLPQSALEILHDAWRYVIGSRQKARLAFNIGLTSLTAADAKQSIRWLNRSLANQASIRASSLKAAILEILPDVEIEKDSVRISKEGVHAILSKVAVKPYIELMPVDDQGEHH